jgi:tripartite-type tricarboxylate transporter receptor subunit TctC
MPIRRLTASRSVDRVPDKKKSGLNFLFAGYAAGVEEEIVLILRPLNRTVLSRIGVRCLPGAFLLAIFLAGTVNAQNFPVKPVRIVVPFPAGGSADFFSRVIAQKLSESWNQQVIVDNRPGAATVIGTQFVARAPADGYTLLVMANSFTINSSLRSNLPYDNNKDFAPVTQLVTSPNVIVVHPSMPAKTFAEFLALARARPGSLNYSAVGPGTTQHVAGEMLKVAAKIDMTYVPFAGGAPAVLAVLGGHVSVCIANIQEVSTHVEAGKLRALAVTSRERDPAMKNVPTVAESGIPDYVVITWWGFVAPAGTPADVIAKISTETGRVLKLPDMQAKLVSQGLYAAPSTPAQFDAHIRSETARYAKIVKEAGIRAD